jgi:hypothetical protein
MIFSILFREYIAGLFGYNAPPRLSVPVPVQ